ncbi:MAG TPA: beta-propeller domain-containing protein, partial [Clostridia bacterium]|nr:beta-propeller domain-containing protein [Clostridia bacterium]
DNKEFAKKLKRQLEDFDSANPLPSSLSKKYITDELERHTGTQKKQAKVIRMKRLASVAAAVVIVFGAATAFHLFGGSTGLQKALDGLKGNASTGHAAVIRTAKSEKQIVDLFKKMSKEAKRKDHFSFRGFFGSKSADGVGEDYNFQEAAGGQDTPTKDPQQGNHGETNVQVKGIDEPDVMKNDGRYLYTVSNGTEVNIYSLLPADKMKLASTIQFGNSAAQNEDVNSLFVKGDLMVVFSQLNQYSAYGQTTTQQVEAKEGESISGYTPVEDGNEGQESPASEGGDGVDPIADQEAPDAQIDIAPAPDDYRAYLSDSSISVCTVYDISNRQAPKEIKRFSQDGSFISARLLGSELYVLSSYEVSLYTDAKLDDICIPMVGVDGESQPIPVRDISITENPEPSYLVVCGINLDDLDAATDKKAVLGGGAEAYCTPDSLFASRTVYTSSGLINNSDYFTEIYRFAIGGGKVEYENSGKVAGHVLNQFSMDEHKGYFRIATTQGDWEKSSSNVFVLNKELEIVGKVENIAPKERIFAVRFMGDAAYVVTFEQTDPLFVLNLSDPKAPKITGELKIPGFSTYLHPVTDTLLFGIGQNGDENGTLPGIKLSLFDVSDPAKPKEVDKLIIQGNSSSEAMNNHKAFMVYPEKGIYGIPVLRYNPYVYDKENPETDDSVTSGSLIGGSEYILSSFETFTLQSGKIVPVMSYKENIGRVDGSYYSGGITRGTYVGDTIYTLSGAALTSFDRASGKLLGAVKVPPSAYDQDDYYSRFSEPFIAD